MTAPVKRHDGIPGKTLAEMYDKLASDYERLEQENSDLRLQCGGMEMDIDDLRDLLTRVSSSYGALLSDCGLKHADLLDEIRAALQAKP